MIRADPAAPPVPLLRPPSPLGWSRARSRSRSSGRTCPWRPVHPRATRRSTRRALRRWRRHHVGLPDAVVILDGGRFETAEPRIVLADCALSSRIAISARSSSRSTDQPTSIAMAKRAELPRRKPPPRSPPRLASSGCRSPATPSPSRSMRRRSTPLARPRSGHPHRRARRHRLAPTVGQSARPGRARHRHRRCRRSHRDLARLRSRAVTASSGSSQPLALSCRRLRARRSTSQTLHARTTFFMFSRGQPRRNAADGRLARQATRGRIKDRWNRREGQAGIVVSP